MSDDTRPVFQALRTRRSHSKVTDDAPSHEELAELLTVMSSVADHSGLRPWRIIELRDDARVRLGEALAQAEGARPEKYIAKATRAPLVLAIVVRPQLSKKVPVWEQEAVASGVAHYLSLLLHENGWGSMWRTGSSTRSGRVRKALGVQKPDYLLGWLYVGGIASGDRKKKPRDPLNVRKHLVSL